jgi:D-methionine transport system ATP-binding protein
MFNIGGEIMIEINNVNKNFDDFKVLSDVSVKINKGEIFGIIGHSGAGKSTLLRCINGLEGYNSGSIRVLDKEVGELKSLEIRELRKNIGMIFQNFNLLNSISVYQNVALPMEVWGKDKKEIKERVTELLKLVGLESKMKSSPKDLSGGQKQRVAIARALTLKPKILLCDEATSALDPKTTKSVLQLLDEINKKLNITIVVVTHQMEVVKQICHRMAIMEDGIIKCQGTVDELFLRPDETLEKLLGEDEPIVQNGVNIKIYFSKEISQKSIITSMARELDIDFSINWGKLEKFRDDILGSLIINVEVNTVKGL